jgi:hypothetical protein
MPNPENLPGGSLTHDFLTVEAWKPKGEKSELPFKFPDWLYNDDGREDVESIRAFCLHHIENYDQQYKFWHTERWRTFIQQRQAACCAWLLAHS